jgi:hypothetical protein
MAKLSGMEESIAKVATRVLSLETGPVGPSAWGSGYDEGMEDVPMTEADQAAEELALEARSERDRIEELREADEDAVFHRIFGSLISGELISRPADPTDEELFLEVARTAFTAHGWLIYEERSPADLQTLADAWLRRLARDDNAATRRAMEELFYTVHDRPASSADPTSLAVFESVHTCFCYEHDYDSRENLPSEALRFFRKALAKAEPSPGVSTKAVRFARAPKASPPTPSSSTTPATPTPVKSAKAAWAPSLPIPKPKETAVSWTTVVKGKGKGKGKAIPPHPLPNTSLALPPTPPPTPNP